MHWVKHKVAEMKLDLSSDQLVWNEKKMNLAFIWIYLWKMYKFNDTNNTDILIQEVGQNHHASH